MTAFWLLKLDLEQIYYKYTGLTVHKLHIKTIEIVMKRFTVIVYFVDAVIKQDVLKRVGMCFDVIGLSDGVYLRLVYHHIVRIR